MGYVPDWSRQDHKKTSGGKAKEGIRHGDSLFHGKQSLARTERSRAFLADGGDAAEAQLKAEGLEASKNENVSFFDRLKAGNVDEVGSEAYKRFGAGRGQTERQISAAENGIMNSSPVSNSALGDASAEDGIMNSSPTRNRSLESMTAADFQRTDKDTTPVPMPSPRRAAPKPAPVATTPAPVAAAPKPATPSLSAPDVQALGTQFAAMDRTLQNTAPSTGGYAQLKKARDDAKKAYEDAVKRLR